MAEQPHHHHKFPEKWAFLLNSPIRRWLDPPEKLIAKLEIGPTDTVVDFGCGPGFVAIPLARIAGRVIGVDVSPVMLEKAKQYAQKEGVSLTFVQSDGSNMNVETGVADLILLNHVFHEVEDKQATLREFSRVLKSSGRIAIVERTRGRRILRGLGPPIIQIEEVKQSLEGSGFDLSNVAPHGKDSIIACRKAM